LSSREKVIRKLVERGLEVAEVLRRGEIPILEYRSLSKTNVIFDLSRRSYKLGDKKVMIRGDRKTSLKRLTSLLFFMRIMKERAEVGISTTKRDYYYLQKSRHPLLQPSSQAESDDIITMAEVHFNMNREIFGVIAQSKGYLYGDITLEEPRLTVNCLKTGGDGYSVPGNVEDIKIKEANIKLMLAIEKEGIYRNLMELGIPEELKIGIAMLGGQPSRGMRRMLRKFSDFGIPIAIWTDLNPYSLRIATNIMYGSIQSAHVPGLSVPSARFIGLEAEDVDEVFRRVKRIALEPLTEEDLRCAGDNLDLPYMQGDEGYWIRQNEWFLEKKKKMELEAFNTLTKHARELKGVYVEYIKRKVKEKMEIDI